MRYSTAPDLTERARKIAGALGFSHIPRDRIACVRSRGTKTRGVIARIHGLGKVVQLGMNCEPFYVIELISERFEKQSPEDQVKTLIHELLHIPHGFGGGFRHHAPYVNRAIVEEAFKKLKEAGWPTLAQY
ncbi:MAG: putative metallopeptidase [Candidatus Diapherotrites archaeon]|nr:putative metallopeptidase [Candidatus Diapherotrites archaeon]